MNNFNEAIEKAQEIVKKEGLNWKVESVFIENLITSITCSLPNGTLRIIGYSNLYEKILNIDICD